MPDWFAITGAITNVATVFDLGYRHTPIKTIINENDAGAILQKVDEILKQSKTVLDNHKSILNENDYNALYEQYADFHWQMTDESQGHRAIRDQMIRQSRILSQLYASTESRRDRAKTLLASVEEYQVDVLSASEAAHIAHKGKRLAMFPDVKSPSESAGPKSFTSWFSFGRPPSPGSQSDIESVAGSDTPSLTSASGSDSSSVSTGLAGYLVAVTHVQDPDVPAGSGPGATSYRRTITFEGGGRRVDVFDDTHRSLPESGGFIDQRSLCRMAKLAEEFLTGVPEGYQILTASPRGSLESATGSFGRLSMGE